MRMHLIAVSALAGLLALPAWAANPSFKCSQASHEVEGLICIDGELAALDRRLSSLYSAVLRRTPASERNQLKAEQRDWLRGRDDCWRESDQRGCVKAAYQQRLRELENL